MFSIRISTVYTNLYFFGTAQVVLVKRDAPIFWDDPIIIVSAAVVEFG